MHLPAISTLPRTLGLAALWGWVATSALSAAAPWATPIMDHHEPVLVLSPRAAELSAAWDVTGVTTVIEDPLSKQPAYELAPKKSLTLRSKSDVSGEYVVEAWVRFASPSAGASPTTGGSAAIRIGVVPGGKKIISAASLRVSRKSEKGLSIAPLIGEASIWGQPTRDGIAPEKNSPTRWNIDRTERFALSTISPVWDPEFRTSIESDMLSIPPVESQMQRLRVEVREDRIRMYVNGFLSLDEANSVQTAGRVQIEASGPALVTKVEVAPLVRSHPRFVSVPLDDVANAKDFVAPASLPAAGSSAAIGGIPFLLPHATASADHLSLQPSVFRYRMQRGSVGDPAECWPKVGQRDPARILLRVPKAAYRRMWLLAAYDGEKIHTPIVTARFFKPAAGWAIDAVGQVPAISAAADAVEQPALPITKADGKPGHLWLVPIELDAAAIASEMRDDIALPLELTKAVSDFRAFPDPMYYGTFQSGLPSGVRIYGLTMEKAAVAMIASPSRHGSVFPYPEKPLWRVDLTNQLAAPQSATVTLTITSPSGDVETPEYKVVLAGNESHRWEYRPKTGVYGIYKIETRLTVGEHVQSRAGTFLALPPDTRKATARTSRFGLYAWHGAHGTNPNADESLQLTRALGSMIAGHYPYDVRKRWGLAPGPVIAFRTVPEWAWKNPYDPAEYAKYSEECGQQVVALLEKSPDLEYVSMYAEHSISLRVTHGNSPELFDQPWFEYTPKEADSIRAHRIAAQAAFEGVRKYAPKVKFLFGHCGPLFSVPFMRENYPKEWFDGYGLDSPQFERMPERQPRGVEPNHIVFLHREMKRLGYDKELVHTESYYPSSHRLALGARGSADSLVRTAVLSLANGTDRFLACWSLHDCADDWGSQHYGCIGLVGRKPEYFPKPAATAFSTLSTMLDTATYDGYLPTGSRSAYCLRFKEAGRIICCAWTIRGARPLVLFGKHERLVAIDEHGNETPVPFRDGQASVTITPTPLWLAFDKTGPDRAEVGTPTYSDTPGENRQMLADFESKPWPHVPGEYDRFAKNHWDMVRIPGTYESQLAQSEARKSQVWRLTLTDEAARLNLAGRYAVFTPPAPVTIAGKAKALGVMARGNSGWGRIVYELVDAKGEVWLSTGTRDAWNCDDIHSWSYFNYDGWRYLQFPLPGNSPGDNFREVDSVWWGHSAEGVLDLPVQLSKVIIEMPTHQVYVDDYFPVENRTIELDDLVAVYDSAEAMSPAPVELQRAAEGALRRPAVDPAALPNPIAKLRGDAAAHPAPKIAASYPPQEYFDGTRTWVEIEPVAAAAEYQIWVSAYRDGRGAMPLKVGPDAKQLVTKLRPGMPLFLFAVYKDAAGKLSSPSEVHEVQLKDEFLQK